MFQLVKESKKTQARLGKLKTAHGLIETPFFMPIATKGAVKHLTASEVKILGGTIILANTYHLYLRPGEAILKKAGGLHRLMDWSGPILTDSGGFQVFSLAKIRKILSRGVEFQAPLDGKKHLLTPEKVLKIQKVIGSDIVMVLDVCPSATADQKEVARAVSLTTTWAKKSKEYWQKNNKDRKQLIFGIIQGGISRSLREESLAAITALNFDGYAIGGLAVGETNQEMYQILDYLTSRMPKDKPRYLMGVGRPENILEAVKKGVDMFDCVIPTREARHGRLYLYHKNKNSEKWWDYQVINILNSRYRHDFSAINKTTLKKYSKAYLHHLFRSAEPLGARLATINNLEFYLSFMEKIRQAIKKGKI